MSTDFDIVSFITDNPVTKLSLPYQNKLINKVKHHFNNDEQQMFVANFYGYLNYNNKTDFVIDVDNIWEWLGFLNKGNCKRTLLKYFTVDIDYKVADGEKKHADGEKRGGYNKERILLNVETFKMMCMLCNTEKGKQIRRYYVKLEGAFFELLDEETSELRQQLQVITVKLKRSEELLRDTLDRMDQMKRFIAEPELKPEKEAFKNVFTHHHERQTIENQQQVEHEADEALKMQGKNPHDFTAFINECCERGDDNFCLKKELYGAYRLWCRNSEGPTVLRMQKYMDEHFKSGKRYYDAFDAKLAIFQGIKLKDYVFKPVDPSKPTEYERFILERCKVGYLCRVSYKIILSEFDQWKKQASNTEERRNFQHYLNHAFFPNYVYISKDITDAECGGANCHGVWGITILNDNSNVGLKLASKLRKKIVQIDVVTKEVLQTFESGTEASRKLKLSASCISTSIRFERVVNGTLLKFVVGPS